MDYYRIITLLIPSDMQKPLDRLMRCFIHIFNKTKSWRDICEVKCKDRPIVTHKKKRYPH